VQDDNLFSHPDYFSIATAMGEYGFKWRASARIDSVSAEKLDHAVANGCLEMGYGIESADPTVLAKLLKGLSIDLAKKTITATKERGLLARLFFMINTPGETPSTPEMNIEFLSETAPDLVTCTIFNPFPGTRIYGNPSEYNITKMNKDPRLFRQTFKAENPHDDKIFVEYSSITNEQQLINRFKMIDYLIDSGIANLGQEGGKSIL
jgi:radical SAM superfamily enzyme YgiQ (UPF0313 family)